MRDATEGRLARSGPPLFVFVLVLGALLRAAPIVERPISLDEARTWVTAEEPLSAFLTWSHHRDHPPLSFLFVRASTRAAGTDAEWALRLPAMIAGILCIPAAAWLGGVVSPAVALALASLVAVDPLLVEQAQTARMYPLLSLLLLLAAALTARVARPESGGAGWVVLGLVLAAGLWTHALGAVLWLAVLAAVPVACGARRQLAGALAIGAILALPGLLAFAPSAGRAVPGHASLVAASLAGSWDLGGAGALVLAAGLGGLLVLARRSPVVAAMLATVAAGTVVAVLVGGGGRPFGIERYLTPVRMAALVGLAALPTAVSRSRRRPAAFAALAVLAVAFGWRAVSRGTPPENEVGRVARALQPRLSAGERVTFRPAFLRHVGAYYGIRPAVAEGDSGRAWMVIQDRRLLQPPDDPGAPALPDEVRRRLPGLAAARGVTVDLEAVERRVGDRHAVAIRLDPAGVRILSPLP